MAFEALPPDANQAVHFRVFRPFGFLKRSGCFTAPYPLFTPILVSPPARNLTLSILDHSAPITGEVILGLRPSGAFYYTTNIGASFRTAREKITYYNLFFSGQKLLKTQFLTNAVD